MRMTVIIGGVVLIAALAPASFANLDSTHAYQVAPAAYGTSRDTRLLWRDRLDFGAADFVAPKLAVGEGHVFYLRNGQVVAADLATGKRLWTYGSRLGGPVAYGRGKVYVGVEDGRVTALWSRTGKPAWLSTSIVSGAGAARINRFVFSRGLLITNTYDNGGTVLDPATGNVRWLMQEHESEGYLGTVGDVLLWGVNQGSPHWHHILGYDLNTGRQLWRARMAAGPLAVEGEKLYLWDQWTAANVDNPDNVAIQVVDGRTGAVLNRWTYRADFRCSRPTELGTRTFALDALFFYLGEQCSERVARFARGGAEAPVALYATPDQGRWIAGPYRNMLFFSTARNQFLGVHIERGRPVILNGVNMPTGPPIQYDVTATPISQLDLIGNQLYVGQTNGIFRAFDVDSGALQLSVLTAGRGFGPTLSEGDYLIVQAYGQVVVIRVRP